MSQYVNVHQSCCRIIMILFIHLLCLIIHSVTKAEYKMERPKILFRFVSLSNSDQAETFKSEACFKKSITKPLIVIPKKKKKKSSQFR